MTLDAEVGVVGVGTMGAQTLWQLAARGVSAIGIEQFSPGHDRSGAGGESRLFRTAYHEGPQYVPLLRRSRELWRRLERESGMPLLTLNGALMIGDPDSAYMTSIGASIERHGIDHELLDGGAVARRYPQHRLLDGEAAYLDRESGYLRPEIAVATATERAEQLGARVLRATAVREIRSTHDAVEVVTDGRVLRFGRLVVSAGAWTERLLLGRVPMIDVLRIVMTWFPTRTPERFTPDVFPIFIRRTAGFDVSGWPSLDGATVKVVVNDGYDRVADPDHLDHDVPDALFDDIREVVATQLHGVLPHVVRAGVYMDGYSADHHPVMGTLPDDDRVVVVGGFSGHGFKMSPAIGEIAAGLVLDGGSEHDLGFAAPSRFQVISTVADRARARRPASVPRPDALAGSAPRAS